MQDSWKWCGTGLPPSTYPDHMMDVLVPLGVALQQIIAVLVCGENWFRWRELGRTRWLVQQKLEQETVHFLWDYFQQWINSHLLLVHTRPIQPVELFTSRCCKRNRTFFFFFIANLTILQLYNIKIHWPYQFKARTEFRNSLADREFPTAGCLTRETFLHR